jgi:hypothetical protein
VLLKSLTSALLLAASMASATPVYYTFAGTVTTSNASAAGYGTGTAISYTFMVDLDAQGYIKQYGVPYEFQDVSDANGTIDHFLVEYVGGSALLTDYNPGSPLEFHRGYSQNYMTSFNSLLAGSNSDPAGADNITVSRNGTFDLWYEGMTGFQSSNTNRQYNIAGAMTLVDISDVNPYAAVPEPTTFAMMGLGLLGLGISVRKRRKA